MEQWKEYRLGEIANIQTGPFGSQLHNKDYVEDGTPIVTVEHLGSKKFTTQNLPCVTSEDRERLKKYSMEEGDVIFSRVGSVDRCSYVDSSEEGWLFSGRCLRVRPTNIIFPLFLYYYLCQPTIKRHIRNIAVGATMPSINTQLLSEVPIEIPALQMQERIASILSSLDDKIELNRKINSNLEEQAKALFKSWFIDFEPFKDGKFIDSELGMIPEGWNMMSFESFISESQDKAMVGTYPAYSVTNNGITPRTEKFKKQLSKATSKEKILRKDDLVFGMSRQILNWGIMQDEIGSVSSAYHVYKIDKERTCPTYLRYFIKGYETYFRDLIGTAAREGQSLDKGALMNKKLLVPSKDILRSFIQHVTTIENAISLFKSQCRRLSTLRDTLLPRLMSGDIEVRS